MRNWSSGIESCDGGDHRLAHPRLLQVGGVTAVGEAGHPQIEVAGHGAVESTQRRPGAGGVAVEGEDHPTAEASQQVEMLLAERGPAGRHRHRMAGEVEGDDVGVPLHHHHQVAAHDLALGPVQPEEQPGLVVDRGLRRVEVLGAVAVEDPGTEPDRVAAQVVDREHQPAPEAVDHPTPARRRAQPGRLDVRPARGPAPAGGSPGRPNPAASTRPRTGRRRRHRIPGCAGSRGRRRRRERSAAARGRRRRHRRPRPPAAPACRVVAARRRSR